MSKITNMQEVEKKYLLISSPALIRNIFEKDLRLSRCSIERKILKFPIVKVKTIVEFQTDRKMNRLKIKDK